MTMKNSLYMIMAIAMLSCKQQASDDSTPTTKAPTVVNFDNTQALNAFTALNLDHTYTNLLDPRNVAPEEYQAITASWAAFHKKVDKYLKATDFKWNVPDSTISIVNRIYFDKNGAIEYYMFRVINPSVPAEKRAEFEAVLQEFSKEVQLDLSRDEQFAQCGKTKYVNY